MSEFKPILPNWIPIEPGEFYYGDENKVLTKVVNEFEIADIVVTEYMYNKTKSNGPMVGVDYKEAINFCITLSKLDNTYDYRLPYSFEWEYVLRNRGKENKIWYDKDNPDELYNYAVYGASEISNVKTKLPRLVDNKYPIYDMEGLVWEWTSSYKDNDYVPINNVGEFTGYRRVSRGGNWDNDAQYLRSGFRINFSTGFRDFDLGFRLVRTLK